MLVSAISFGSLAFWWGAGHGQGQGQGHGYSRVSKFGTWRSYTMTRTADDSFVFVIGLIWAHGFGKFL